MTKFIQLNTFSVKVFLCFLFVGAMRTSFGQFCYGIQVSQPNCSGDLGQIQYSVLNCGCNYSTNGPWVFRIGTSPNFSNASAIFTSSLTSNPVFVFSNLPAGTYYVRAHYNNATTKCTNSELSVVISSPPQIQLSSTLTSSSIDLSVTGGTPGYTYSWSNGATTEDLSNLSPGTYSVVVTDLNGCTVTASYTVQNQNPVLSVNLAISNILCFGDQNGMINLTVAGGNAPYNVSWTGPVSGNPAGNEIANSGGSYLIANMPAGIYTVTVTDSNGNSTNISATITQPQSPLTLSTMTTNNLCFGAQTGAIDLTVSGGTGIYAYSWNTGAITQDITGLAAGLYMVTLIDANGCTATTVATITQPQSPLTLTTTQVNVLCNGANTGSINLTPTGGTAPYAYLWSNGSTVQDPQNLAAGTYSVVVTDANGCTAFASVVITQPANPLSASYVQTNVTCNGLSNGSINVTVTGGAQPYTYAWSHGPTTEDLTGLSAGTYNLTITYAQQCTSSLSVTITEPLPILLTGSVNGNNIDITVSGGTPGYTYSWSNGATTEDLSNLSPGTYSVVVTDLNGCTVTASYTVLNQNPVISVNWVSNILCFGGQDGMINLTVAGGNAPYNVSWTGPVSGNPAGNEIANSGGSYLIANLPAGIYTVTVTDANGALDIIQLVITQPTPIVTSYYIASVTCYGGNDGNVFLNISGGVPSYIVQWSNGSISQNLLNLSVGVYNFIITDANNCTMQGSINITQPLPLTITSVIGANNIDITVSGGTAPYVYLWSNGATTQDVTNLSSGTYSVTVTDANNCTASASYAVQNQNPVLSVNSIISPVLCFGGQDGSINVTVAGGNAPYNVSWSGPVSGNPAGNEILNSGGSYIIANIPAGTYTLTITDSNGNADTQTVTITQPQSSLLASAVGTNVLCNGVSTGSINLTVSGGTGIYTYVWNTGAITQDIFGLVAGTYTVTVTDANNCMEQASATITQPQAPLTASSTQVNVLCYGANTGSIDVSVSGGTLPYTYTWSNGVVGQDLVNIPSGTFSLTVTDANACTATTSATITQPSALLLTGSVNGNNIDISVSGGTVPYNYSWSSGDVTQDLANVSSGTYSVTVTDAFNCSISDTFTVDNAGLEQQQSIELQVFPNPAQGVVTIHSSSSGIGNTYRISDCYGRNVLEGTLTSQENNINIQTLANGVYHVKCGSETRALVISH